MTQTRRQIKAFPRPFATAVLLAMAVTISAILYHLSRLRDFDHHVPQFIALFLAVGAIYLASVCLVEQRPLGWPALFVILAAAAAFRLILLPAKPPLSDDVYRYQWEGKVQELSINPYTVYPAQPDLQRLQDPRHAIRTGAATPSAYPPLSEISFTWSRTVSGYKNLYTAFDLATAVILLLILGSLRQPLHRALTYLWNPAVLIAFSLCGHQDSLAIFALMAACLLIIARKPLASNAFLALSVVSKFFAVLLLPFFLKRPRWASGGVFAAVVALFYLHFASAGWQLFHGLSGYAANWENNDSLFRLISGVSASRTHAELVAGALLLTMVAAVVVARVPLLRAGLFVTATLLLLSPNAFPWYFTWSVPFLCFCPYPPWLLMTATCVLGYAPVIAYTAGQPYRDSPLILTLEYAPVLAWLAWSGWKRRSWSRADRHE